MKPKPLVSLNHLTVPVVRMCELLLCCCESEYGRAERTDYNCDAAVDPHGRVSRHAPAGSSDTRKGPACARPSAMEPERSVCTLHTWREFHSTGWPTARQAKK